MSRPDPCSRGVYEWFNRRKRPVDCTGCGAHLLGLSQWPFPLCRLSYRSCRRVPQAAWLGRWRIKHTLNVTRCPEPRPYSGHHRHGLDSNPDHHVTPNGCDSCMLACAQWTHIVPGCARILVHWPEEASPPHPHSQDLAPCVPFYTLQLFAFCTFICVTTKVPAVSLSASIIMHGREILIMDVLCSAALDDKSHVLSSQSLSTCSQFQSNLEALIFPGSSPAVPPLRQTCGDLLRLASDRPPPLGFFQIPWECTYSGIDVVSPAFNRNTFSLARYHFHLSMKHECAPAVDVLTKKWVIAWLLLLRLTYPISRGTIESFRHQSQKTSCFSHEKNLLQYPRGQGRR